MCGKQGGNPQDRPGSFAPAGSHGAAPEFAKPIRRHLEAFDRSFQFRCTGAKSDEDTLCGTPLVNGKEIAPDFQSLSRGFVYIEARVAEPHGPDLLDQLLRNFSAYLTAGRDLLCASRCGMSEYSPASAE